LDDLLETVGQTLRRKREEKHLSVGEVALQTRIQSVFINAIEEGQFDKIASPVSVKGFVRSYARFLKVDEAEILHRLSECLSAASATPISASADPPKTEATPAQTLLFPMGVELRDAEPLSRKPVVDMGTVGSRIQKTPHYSRWIGISVVCFLVVFLFTFYAPWEHKNSAILAPTQTQSGSPISPDTASLDDAPVMPALQPDVASDIAPKKVVPSDLSVMNATLKPFVLSLEAREPTWVKVLIDGKGTKDVLLQVGQKAVWQADKTFLLTMGNGGGAEVSLDGKDLGFLGKRGEVVRDRLLTRVASEQIVVDDD